MMMFTFNVLPDSGGTYQLTIVRPDHSTRSTSKDSLAEVLEVVKEEIDNWKNPVRKHMSDPIVMDDQ
jgi:hypothetical protein